jgi:predicted esterase
MSLLVALVLVASACNSYTQGVRIDGVRTAAGLPKLPSSPVLAAAAQSRSDAMCAARSVSAAAPAFYDGETAAAVQELVGSARGNPTLPHDLARNTDALDQIWAQWKTNPALVDPKWTDMGIGSTNCADGKLYMAAALRQAPFMPATGRYSTPQHDASAVQVFSGIQYTTAPNASGVVQPVLLDLFVPPGAVASPRPLIIQIHGGAFVGGSRTSSSSDAMEFARRGFVAASIDYRLISVAKLGQIGQFAAAQNALIDAQQAVRWLKANAVTYGIDATRVAAIGFSAGGALSLGSAVAGEATTSGPLAGYSPSITAAVSTGAYLTPGLPFLTLNADEAPVMMFQYDYDNSTNVTADYAFQTCDALRAAGSTCDEVPIAGTGHTTWLIPGGPWWTHELGPFLWTQLRLGG